MQKKKRLAWADSARIVRACILVAVMMVPIAAYADWQNLSGAETARNIAEIRVTDTGINIALEIYPEDIDSFWLNERIALAVHADGVKLEPTVLLIEQRRRTDRVSPFAGMIDPRTRQRIPGPPEDDRVLFAEFEYDIPGKPERLMFTPPLDAAGATAVTIGFLAFHKEVPVNDFRYLSGASTLILDWDDPWFSAFENRNLTRHHKWPQMSFLYIEPREVRHEILVRVRDLMEWTQENPDIRVILSGADKLKLQQAAREFFLETNPLRIDEVLARQSTFRAEYLRITPAGLKVIESDVPIDASAAILGVSLSYWTESLPQTVTVDWQLFDERVERVPTNAMDPAGPFPSFVTADDPRIEWQNFLKNYQEPMVRAISTGSEGFLNWETLRLALLGTPDQETAVRIVGGILENAAVAFLERDPEALDAALLHIVSNEGLADVRMELAGAFAVPTTGGGVASVESIRALELTDITELSSAEGFSVLAGWTETAVGHHWGHVDNRSLRFRALMDIVRDDDCWKLLGVTVVDIQPAGL